MTRVTRHTLSGRYLAWENSLHLATLPLVSPPNEVWETNAEIPYKLLYWLVIVDTTAAPVLYIVYYPRSVFLLVV